MEYVIANSKLSEEFGISFGDRANIFFGSRWKRQEIPPTTMVEGKKEYKKSEKDRVTPAFRFCLSNSTLTQAIPIRYPFFCLSHIIVTPTERSR